jgi:outer membrane protein assembly factor BamB
MKPVALLLVVTLGQPAFAQIFPRPRAAAPQPTPRPLTATPRPAVPSPAPPVVAPSRQVWKTFLRRIDATSAVVGTTSYVAAGTALHRIDAGGRIAWTTDIGATQATPTVDGARVFVGTDRGQLVALDTQTGKPLWRFTASNTIRCAPAVGAGLLIVEACDNNVYGLEVATGKLVWKTTRADGSLGYAAPRLVGDGAAVYVCGENTLYRLDPTSGREVWKATLGGRSLATPQVADGRIYTAGDGAGLCAVAEENGAVLWRFPGDLKGDWFGPPLLVGDTIYVSTYKRFVYAIEAATGRKRWALRVLGPALATPALDRKRGVLYVSSATFRNNPTLTAIDARKGTKLWDTPLGYLAASPVLSADGSRLFVGGLNGYYHAFALD